jgi:hypothetical protein
MTNTLEFTTNEPTPEEIDIDREHVFNGADELRNATNLYLGATALTELVATTEATEQKATPDK